MILILITISCTCRAVEQITVNRRHMSWLPAIFTARGARFNLDGYHIISAGEWITAILAGTYLTELWHLIPLYIFHGQLFDLLYHVLLIYPQQRDYKNSLLGQLFNPHTEV